MESKKVRYIFDNNNVMISKYQLIFLYTLIFWALIYIFFFVTQPSWAVTDAGYLLTFANGSGVPNSQGQGNLSNTLLSDEGRSSLLWVSFLFALLVGLLLYLLFFFTDLYWM